MLSIQNLTIIHKKDLTTLIENVCFSVSPGERLALIGEEGNGKSTLLRHIRDMLQSRADLNVFYMPQDPDDLLDMDRTPPELLIENVCTRKAELAENGWKAFEI